MNYDQSFAICFSVLHKFTDDQKEKWFWNFPNFEMVESWEELMTFFSSQHNVYKWFSVWLWKVEEDLNGKFSWMWDTINFLPLKSGTKISELKNMGFFDLLQLLPLGGSGFIR